MLIKDISYLELCQPLSSVDPNHLCNFDRVYHEEQFCEIILNLGQWFRRCRLKDFLSGPLAALLFIGAEPFMQFWKREHSYEVWNLDQWFKRCRLQKKFTDGRWTRTDHNSSPWAFGLRPRWALILCGLGTLKRVVCKEWRPRWNAHRAAFHLGLHSLQTYTIVMFAILLQHKYVRSAKSLL